MKNATMSQAGGESPRNRDANHFTTMSITRDALALANELSRQINSELASLGGRASLSTIIHNALLLYRRARREGTAEKQIGEERAQDN